MDRLREWLKIDRAGKNNDEGASYLEYLGLVCLAVLIFGAVIAAGIPGKISNAIGGQIDKVTSGQPSGTAGSPPANPPAAPATSPPPANPPAANPPATSPPPANGQ
ncbi:hypothetical protein [Actinoallomurus iriomotensis]|uniref:Uncharacterized protein n=1 Tax=Actinoallomurus iriomotensis TaxID=478107 RepID=A0A9W6VYX2_9ACTN|nr:hypothetical protein [Actinoallomurus iriomotensis]GLY85310.1 hypothetical protein Airi02_032390 [Actinoallomurus iriomotensis]